MSEKKIEPLQSRIMTVEDVQVIALELCSRIRTQLMTSVYENPVSDQQFLDQFVVPVETEIQTDQDVKRMMIEEGLLQQPLPTAQQNPDGFHAKYIVRKADGQPVDPAAIYFVLRLDGTHQHNVASRLAALVWAANVQNDANLAKTAAELQATVKTLAEIAQMEIELPAVVPDQAVEDLSIDELVKQGLAGVRGGVVVWRVGRRSLMRNGWATGIMQRPVMEDLEGTLYPVTDGVDEWSLDGTWMNDSPKESCDLVGLL